MAIQSEWIEITPALAKEYLSRAAPNRPLRMRRIEAYARDMETANWLATGQPVLFNTAGELIDGWNASASSSARLAARATLTPRP